MHQNVFKEADNTHHFVVLPTLHLLVCYDWTKTAIYNFERRRYRSWEVPEDPHFVGP